MQEPLILSTALNIKKDILAGKYKNFLPPDIELCSYYNISKSTLRTALRYVLKWGLLFVGKNGYQVSKRPENHILLFTDRDIVTLNGDFTDNIISTEIVTPTIFDVYYLSVHPNSSIMKVKTLTVDKQGPIAYNIYHFPYIEGKTKLELKGVSHTPRKILYNLYEESSAEEQVTFESGPASDEVARNLMIDPGDAIMCATTFYRDEEGQILLFVESNIIGNRFELSLISKPN